MPINKAQQSQGLKSGFFNREAFIKKRSLTLVLKTGIAGLHFHFDLSDEINRMFLDSLMPGTELMLYRDTDNEHDDWAISVYTKEDVMLGYISRFKNETIARLMDEGRKFVALVDEPPDFPEDDPTYIRRHVAPTEDYTLPIAIYMED